jgi:hypothetical protein
MHHMLNNKFTPTSSAGGFLTPLSQVMSLVSYLQSVERLRKYLKAQAFKFLLAQTDRQLALLKISIEAGILLCGNGFHAMMVARTRRS